MRSMKRGSWSEISSRGIGYFVWRFGVVCFGGSYFVMNTPVRWLSNNPDQRYEPGVVMALVAVSLAYSVSVGAVFGFAAWYLARLVAWGIGHFASGRAEEPLPEPVLRARSAATNK